MAERQQINKLNPQVTMDRLSEGVVAAVSEMFPVEGNRRRIEVSNVRVSGEKAIDDIRSQRKARMTGRTWAVPIIGDFRIVDKESGRVVGERKNMRVMSLPHITRRFSYIIDGKEYAPDNQFRLKSGVYHHIRGNGQLSAQWNLAKGRGFSIEFEPDRGRFMMRYGTSNISLVPVLQALGVTEDQMRREWGNKAYERITSYKQKGSLKRMAEQVSRNVPEGLDDEGYANIIKDALAGTELRTDTTKITLGKPFSSVNGEALLKSAGKLLNINRGAVEPDERDSLRFASLLDISDHIPERIRNSRSRTLRKIRSGIDRKDDPRQIVPIDVFSVPVKTFFTTTSLAQQPEQTNPVHMLGGALRTTIMGQGGIGSDHAVNLGAKVLDDSRMGILDPVYTPEGSRTGITNHLALGVGKAGTEPLLTLFDPKTGARVRMTPAEAHDKTIAFADEYRMKKVDGTRKYTPKNSEVVAIPAGGGDPQPVRAKDVDYVLRSPQALMSVATALVPFAPSDQANRLGMADRHLEQAVSLVHREEPLVQSASAATSMEKSSWEKNLGGSAAHKAPASGEVVAIKDDAIIIKDANGKRHEAQLYRNFPLNDKKGVMHSEPIVSVGDTVKEGEVIADSNYTRGGVLAQGVNLRTAYLPFKGLTFEDGVVVSETGAERLTSLHLHKLRTQVSSDTTTDAGKFRAQYPGKLTEENAKKLDGGIIKVGQKVMPGDILATVLRKRDPSEEQILLRGIHRSLDRQWQDSSITWDKPYPGVVTDVKQVGGEIKVFVRTEEPAQIGDKLCYAEDHELLTDRGWKPVAQVGLTDRLASLRPDGSLEYVEPDEVHHYPHSGRMYSLQTQQLDMLVTEEHKLYVKPRNKDDYGLYPAREVFGKRMRFKMDAVWEGDDQAQFTFPAMTVAAGQSGNGTRELPPVRVEMDTMMMLLGAWLSDGHCFSQESSGNYGLEITVLRPKKRATLFGALRDCGVQFIEIQKGARIYSKQMQKYFAQFGHAHEKFIPEWVFTLPPARLQVLWDWFVWGDGSSDGRAYHTTSPRLADGIQRLLLLIGKAGRISLDHEGGPQVIKGRLYQTRPKYSVRVLTKRVRPQVNHGHARTQNGQLEEWVDYEGTVFCVTLPRNHVLYTRRNGRAHWSGNSGRHGNKGVITAVLPDDEMPKDADGNPAHVIMNPSGVPGRINLGQVLETSLAKVAEAEGNIIEVSSFAPTDGERLGRIPRRTKKIEVDGHWRTIKTNDGAKRIWIEPYSYEKDYGYQAMVQKVLDEAGISETEEMFDPETGESLGQVLVGPQYILKHTHQVDKKMTARAHGAGYGYDVNGIPRSSFGKDDGAQRFGELGLYSMLAHGAVHNIRDALTYKSNQSQDEVWTAVQTGQPLPAPQESFAYTKFLGYLAALGVNVEKEGSKLHFLPMTDKQILEMSNGELTDAARVVRGKDLGTEEGGLFDEKVTGGLDGDKWSHIALPEKFPNPVFEKAILSLLGMRRADYRAVIKGDAGIQEDGSVSEEGGDRGPGAIARALGRVDIKKERAAAEEGLRTAKGADLNRANRKVRYFRALEKAGLTPDEAYTLGAIPVVPPQYRPMTVMESGDLNVDGLNLLYREVALIKGKLDEARGVLPEEELRPLQEELYNAISGLMGTSGASDLGMTSDGTERPPGILSLISGPTGPKSSFFHKKLMDRKQDLTARSIIVPDMDLHLDEVGVPRKAAKRLFRPFVVRRLHAMGYTPVKGQEMIDNDDPVAMRALKLEMDERPVIFKRDPVLHKFGIQAFKPVLVEGKSIHIHPLTVGGFGADFDGDAMSLFVPVSPEAVEEAKGMMPSKNLFNPATGKVMFQPSMEGQLGLFLLTQFGKDTKQSFRSIEAVRAAHQDKKLKATDVVSVGGRKTTPGRIAVAASLPAGINTDDVLYDKKFVMGGKQLQQVMRRIATEQPAEFAKTMDKMKKLGFGYASDTGFSFSLKDFKVLTTVRDKHLKKAKRAVDAIPGSTPAAQRKAKIVEIYTKATADIEREVKPILEATGNKIYAMNQAGVKPSWIQVRQMLIAPMLVENSKGEVIPAPVTRSYSEGLTSSGFWTAAYGARKGLIEKVQSVSEPGALSKQIVNTTLPLSVTKDDCGTAKGILMPLSDRGDIDGRYLAEPLRLKGGRVFRAGTVLSPSVVNSIRTSGVSNVLVRSPHKCEAAKGLCGKCYGNMDDGKPPEVGTNIGLMAGQAIGERGTQLSMKNFHQGGVAGGTAGVTSGLPRIIEVLKMPKVLPGKATLAAAKGTVDQVRPSPLGGFEVKIGGKDHYVPGNRQITIKAGDTVRKGDAISSGPVDPRELLELTNIGRVQAYITGEIQRVYAKEGIKRRNMEVLTRALTNLGVVEDAGTIGEEAGMLRGDFVSVSAVNALNKEKKGTPIKVKPVLRGVETLPLDQMEGDLVSRLQYRRLKETYQRGFAEGWTGDIHGIHPAAGLLYSKEFGKKTDKSTGPY